MSATRRMTPQEIDLCCAVARRSNDGATQGQIAKEFGLKVAQVSDLVRCGVTIFEGRRTLRSDPTNMDALTRAGRLAAAFWILCHYYEVRNLRTLAKQKWSRAELLLLDKVGKKSVDEIEAAMREFDLTLHPDRDKPLDRPRKRERRTPEDWAKKDRAFIIQQAKNVSYWFAKAREVLTGNLDDEQAFALIARTLQQLPRYINPLSDEVKRLDETEAMDEEIQEAYAARQEANKRLVELTVVACGGGNVIQFPRPQA